MQILHWLERKCIRREEERNSNNQNDKGKDIVLLDHHRAHRRTKRNEERKLGCKKLKLFAFIYKKDIPKACFYSTLNLKRLRSFNGRQHFIYSMKMKREERSIRVGISSNNRADSAVHVRNKVLPVTEASFSRSETRDEAKGKKKKPISRMKELVRWAAASRTEKRGKLNERKVVQFQRQGFIKSVEEEDDDDDDDDDHVISESANMSFTTSSVHSLISMPSSTNIRETQLQNSSNLTCTKGNWITTDSEFVVLEL